MEESLWDSHADLYLGPIDLRVGRQIVSWGGAELLAINDVINPRDYRRSFLERPEELRIPVLAARATAHWGPLLVEGVWLPRAPGNRMTALETDFALLGPNAPTIGDRQMGSLLTALDGVPEADRVFAPLDNLETGADGKLFKSNEIGARAGLRAVSSTDFFVYALRGHTRDPQINVAPETAGRDPNDRAHRPDAGAVAHRAPRDSGHGQGAVRRDPRQLRAHRRLALDPTRADRRQARCRVSRGRLVPRRHPAAVWLSAQYLDADQVSGAVSLDYNRGSDLVLIVEGSYTKTLHLPPGVVVLQTTGTEQADGRRARRVDAE